MYSEWRRAIGADGMGHETGEDAAASLPPPVPLADIRQGLAEAWVTTRYQPMVRIADRVPMSLEVLARLDHPLRGVLAPDLFVPQIEAAALGLALTQAVIARAFADWPGAALKRLGLALALNVPLDVLLMPEALAWLDAARRAAGIAPGRIIVELTESQPVSRLYELRETVAGLRRAGYGLAIDDVGPGLRDHTALLALDFSAVKLDKGLVGAGREDAAAQAFLRRAIADGHAASLTVVAEGIEDSATWARMADLGADEAQGFLIARPMPAAAVAGWHRDWCAARGGATI